MSMSNIYTYYFIVNIVNLHHACHSQFLLVAGNIVHSHLFVLFLSKSHSLQQWALTSVAAAAAAAAVPNATVVVVVGQLLPLLMFVVAAAAAVVGFPFPRQGLVKGCCRS
jgi:hypothetical protein